jgi:hypothetical protein
MTEDLLNSDAGQPATQDGYDIPALLPVEGGKPADLPEKFWDGKGQAIRLAAILQSYRELERKLSTMLPSPESDEDRMRVLRVLGVPEKPEDYSVNLEHGLFQADPDLNRRMFEKGFTADQVQAVYDIAAEKFVPLVFEIAEEFRADREVERLMSAFGGAEKWQEVSRQLLSYGRKNLPKDVLENLSSSFEGVMALYRMMKGQEPSLTPDAFGKGAEGGNEDNLRQMMRDPRYWRERDPQYVAKVTEGFQRIYKD